MPSWRVCDDSDSRGHRGHAVLHWRPSSASIRRAPSREPAVLSVADHPEYQGYREPDCKEEGESAKRIPQRQHAGLRCSPWTSALNSCLRKERHGISVVPLIYQINRLCRFQNWTEMWQAMPPFPGQHEIRIPTRHLHGRGRAQPKGTAPSVADRTIDDKAVANV